MRIILADDHTIIRQGLRALLALNPSRFEVIGEAESGSQAVELAKKLKPDVVIMDINMPELDGIAATGMIKKELPDVKIMILSMFSDTSFIRRAFKAGASGFIPKEAAFNELILGIECVITGKPYLSPSLLQHVMEEYVNITPDREIQAIYNKLTPREKEVFKLLAKGYSRNTIAKALFISPKTVDQHKQSIKEKLNVHSETDLLEFVELLNQY